MNHKHTLLRKYRLDNDLSCADFAKKLGVAEVTVRSMENGTRPITAERAVDIEQATDGAIRREQLRPDLFEVRAA